MVEILILLAIYGLCFVFYRVTAIDSINQISRHSKFYPKHFTTPPGWLKKCFNLKKSEIPKFLCFRLVASLGFAVAAVVVLLIYVIVQPNETGLMILLFAPCAFLIPDNIQFYICQHIFSNKKKKKQPSRSDKGSS